MSIVTFWGSGKEQVGKTLSLVAIATNMAIDHNKKVLIVSASYNNDTLKNCYWKEKTKEKLSIVSQEGKVSLDNGIEGLAKIIESNKITPELITNYTKIVFKDRLEVLLGFEGYTIASDEKIANTYIEIIKLANKYYDIIFIDLDNEIQRTGIETIVKMSDVVVAMTSQRVSSIEKIKEKKDTLVGKKGILLIGKYDKESKYTIKNLTRYLGERKEILAIPYNTLFFEAAEEGNVTDLFLRLRNVKDKSDKNTFFIQQIRNICDEIANKIREVKMIN